MARIYKGINVDELEQLTLDGWKTTEIADRYGVNRQFIHWVRIRFNLTRVKRAPRQYVPSDDDDTPEETLKLSPWVKARIKELGLGAPA